MKASGRILVFIVGSLAAGLGACSDPPTICPAILYARLTLPDTTTIKVGASTIAIAGAVWGGCDAGPPPNDFVWSSSDSSVATVSPIDSLHARIQGRRLGVAVIAPRYRITKLAEQPSPVRVTVVP